MRKRRATNWRRVGEDVATLTPHRPGRADFPHPVLHGRGSLTVNRHSLIKDILASSAIHCRFVDRFAGSKSLPVFPANGSLRVAPPFPPSGPGEPGSPLSAVL